MDNEAPTGMDPSAASVRNALGRTIWYDPTDVRGQHLAARAGDLNASSLRLWQALFEARAWDVVFDVGANYGEMLLGVDIARVPVVVAFEPNPRVLPHLRRSLSDAALSPAVRELAVSSRAGETLVFAIDVEWSGMSGIAAQRRDGGQHRVEEIAVQSTTLDAEIAGLAGLSDQAAVLVKIDVEGAEHAVLEGARGLLQSGRPSAVMLEVLHMTLDEHVALLRDYDVAGLDLATGSLVRLPAMSAEGLRTLQATGWIYPQDLVLLSPTALPQALPSVIDIVAAREAVIAPIRERAARLDEVEATLAAVSAQRDAAAAERDAVFASTSWRVTAPLRAAVRAVRGH